MTKDTLCNELHIIAGDPQRLLFIGGDAPRRESTTHARTQGRAGAGQPHLAAEGSGGPVAAPSTTPQRGAAKRAGQLPISWNSKLFSVLPGTQRDTLHRKRRPLSVDLMDEIPVIKLWFIAASVQNSASFFCGMEAQIQAAHFGNRH